MAYISRTKKQYLDQAEEFVDRVLREVKPIIPTLGRLCFVSTFIEDGLRMLFYWDDQVEYIGELWGTGKFLASIFVIFNMLLQLVGASLVLIRRNPFASAERSRGFGASSEFSQRASSETDVPPSVLAILTSGANLVPLACTLLFVSLILQIIGYRLLFQWDFLFSYVALAGCLVFLLAECLSSPSKGTTMFAGVPSVSDVSAPKSYLMLSGRLLIVPLFLLTMQFELNPVAIFWNISGIVLVPLVAIGYKTKLSSVTLGAIIFLLNFYLNAFWMIPSHRTYRDIVKYEFFQSISFVGGLLLLVGLGPGSVSFDEHKKKW